jgi:hypothetical protein
MRRWAGLVGLLVYPLLFSHLEAADQTVVVSTVPKSFAPGETVTVKVEVLGIGALFEAGLALYVTDSTTVLLSASHPIGALGAAERKSYEFPETFVAPTTLHGKYLTVTVLLLGNQVVSPSFYVGGRHFVRQCKQAEGVKDAKTGRLTCVYKTPVQIAIDATVNQPSPRPHP